MTHASWFEALNKYCSPEHPFFSLLSPKMNDWLVSSASASCLAPQIFVVLQPQGRTHETRVSGVLLLSLEHFKEGKRSLLSWPCLHVFLSHCTSHTDFSISVISMLVLVFRMTHITPYLVDGDLDDFVIAWHDHCSSYSSILICSSRNGYWI